MPPAPRRVGLCPLAPTPLAQLLAPAPGPPELARGTKQHWPPPECKAPCPPPRPRLPVVTLKSRFASPRAFSLSSVPSHRLVQPRPSTPQGHHSPPALPPACPSHPTPAHMGPVDTEGHPNPPCPVAYVPATCRVVVSKYILAGTQLCARIPRPLSHLGWNPGPPWASLGHPRSLSYPIHHPLPQHTEPPHCS